MKGKHFAIIDIGSNTTRLVIYFRENNGNLKEVENVKSVSRLRSFLETDYTLNPSGVDRLIKTLKSFQEVMITYELQDIICVATATIRQAVNQAEIIDQVKKKTGLSIQILSEQEEAYYGYLAVVNSTSIKDGITVDIGGGSTEVTLFQNRELLESHSFSFGALTLKDFFKKTIPTDKEIQLLRQYLNKQFATLPWLQDKELKLIAIGGSARNLAQIHQNLTNYPLAGLHQYEMSSKDIIEVNSYLTSLVPEKLVKVEGLSRDRADIIIPAIEVFHCLYQVVQAESLMLSRKGLRDGVFYQRLATEKGKLLFPKVIDTSIQKLIDDYHMNTTQIQHVQALMKVLFDYLKGNGLMELEKADWVLLQRASCLFHLGDYIDSEASAQHTFYLLANRTIDGLEHKDRVKLALIASYKNNTLFKQFIQPFKSWFLKKERHHFQHLGALLKFVYSLDTTKRQVVKKLTCSMEKNRLNIQLKCDGDAKPEIYQSEKHKKHLEKAIKREIILKL
ncbi:exopolyphosphatase [Ornithinibacillus sp. 4-3]|uniref:exopolyphosphatase n=1 Tax=Ornithinibacillus sp. 4-3 TaxID=3231488 RepID=A0AB39HV74_9BACI